MHNVNVEELQTLQNSNTCSNSKQIKLELNDCATPSPLGSDSGIEADCADGNLSWLLNYKIHELPPVPGIYYLLHTISTTNFRTFSCVPTHTHPINTVLKTPINCTCLIILLTVSPVLSIIAW